MTARAAVAATGERPAPAIAPCDLDGVALPASARERLSAYVDLLAKWNRTYNLTAIRERPQMITHHLHDALAVLPFLPRQEHLRVLDIGTGGGIPGIPLAIARPDWTFVLLDASQKKATFVTQAAIELQLRNVTVVASRAEEFVADAPFDVVISRAFSDLATFARMAMRHVAHDGVMVAMKGALPRDEIAALPADVAVTATPALHVPGLDAERHLVLMRARPREIA
jgi:16S rRNA (guanine527-N7)-methyltransferase